jgi:DNA polymerase III delta prime subunit
MSKLNLQINKFLPELTKKTDLFGTYEKMEFIKTFLNEEVGSEYLRENNMIVLYGNWGSGKTTLIHALEKELDRQKYKPMVFYAWKYEKDDNLAFSLYECLLDKLIKDSKQKKEYIKTARDLLIGGLKGVNISVPFVNIDPHKVIKGIEEALLEKKSENSFYSKIKNFEVKFNKLVEQILKEQDKKMLIVFIDDLDRCEPDHILDLLAMVKLFFTLGKESVIGKDSKIIFFCGIDKDAVKKAVKKRYGDIIKSEEYLEKIFDLSFEMPIKAYKIDNFLNSLKIFDEKNETPLISSFFETINFSNPRRIKKVANKYLILCRIKKDFKNKYTSLIPAVIKGDGNGYVFDTIMVLYFIILHEFYINKYYELQNYDAKFSNYFDHFKKEDGSRLRSNDIQNRINLSLRANNNFFNFKNLNNRLYLEGGTNPFDNFQKFLSFFTPKIMDPDKILFITSIQGDSKYFEQFEYGENQILIDLCRFIHDRKNEITIKESKRTLSNDYNLFTLFDMVETLL